MNARNPELPGAGTVARLALSRVRLPGLPRVAGAGLDTVPAAGFVLASRSDRWATRIGSRLVGYASQPGRASGPYVALSEVCPIICGEAQERAPAGLSGRSAVHA